MSGSHFFEFVVASTNTSVAIGLLPGNFVRLSNIQKAFEFYRFTKLVLEVVPWVQENAGPVASSVASLGALGFYPELTTATLTSISAASVLSLDASIILAGSSTNATGGVIQFVGHTASRFLRVPKRILMATPVRWYRTQGTASSEDSEITQGLMIAALTTAAGASTVVMGVKVSYTCEFTANVDSTTLTTPDVPDMLLGVPRLVAERKEEASQSDALRKPDSFLVVSARRK